MFNKPTVFVLGAGASAEFGLPTGAELAKKICDGLRFRFDFSRQIDGDANLFQSVKNRFKDDRENINRFTHAGSELSSTINTFPSVDEALHWWSDRSEIVEFGKAAIAHYILDAEQSSSLAVSREAGSVDVARADTTWASTFLSIALAGVSRANVVAAFDKVTLVNFNYDRIVEQYLYWGLQQRAGVSSDMAAETVSRLKIIRPYGALGPLNWKGGNEVSFGLSRYDPFHIAANIRTFTEQFETDLKSKIDGAVEAASLVVWLSFGFHQQNLALFKPGEGKNRGVTRTVMATSFGIDPRNHAAIRDICMNSIGFRFEPLFAPLKSHALMNELRLSITVAAA